MAGSVYQTDGKSEYQYRCQHPAPCSGRSRSDLCARGVPECSVCHSFPASHSDLYRQIVQPTFKPTIVTNSESLSDPLAEHSQSFYGLIAEDKADVAVGYSASPAAHGRGGDLVFQEALRDFEAVEA
jgi:hypothetical protein